MDRTAFAEAHAAPLTLKKLNQGELQTLFESHDAIVRTKPGKKLDLHDYDLRGLNLSGRVLEGSNFKNADLRGASVRNVILRDANLVGANLRDADLEGTDLTGAKLDRASFCHASMKDAVLKDVKGLITEKLAGADVCCTNLPDEIKQFSGLSNVAEASKNATITFVSMLVASLYSSIALGTTVAPNPAGTSVESLLVKLPLLDVSIKQSSFGVIAPVILFCVYMYFHLQLLRLWELLADMPAIFPDGVPLDKKAYPWLFNGVVIRYLPQLQKRPRPHLWGMQVSISMLLACWTVPVTLLWLWYRTLVNNLLIAAMIDGVLALITIWFGFYFYGIAKTTLCHLDRTTRGANRATILAACALAGLFYLLRHY